jgi:hypothetical protein
MAAGLVVLRFGANAVRPTAPVLPFRSYPIRRANPVRRTAATVAGRANTRRRANIPRRAGALRPLGQNRRHYRQRQTHDHCQNYH